VQTFLGAIVLWHSREKCPTIGASVLWMRGKKMNTYEKLRNEVSDILTSRSREIARHIGEISSNFKILGLEVAVWHPDKIHTANLGGVDAETYIGYSRIEGRWGLVIRTIERDRANGGYVGQRILTLEACNNMEIVANALKKVQDLAQLIHKAIQQQQNAMAQVDVEIEKIRDLDTAS
jgi:hypothetical protein